MRATPTCARGPHPAQEKSNDGISGVFVTLDTFLGSKPRNGVNTAHAGRVGWIQLAEGPTIRVRQINTSLAPPRPSRKRARGFPFELASIPAPKVVRCTSRRWRSSTKQSLGCDNIGKTVRFLVKGSSGKTEWIETKIAAAVRIKSSVFKNGEFDRRYKVRLTLQWKEFRKEVLVTLNDRTEMAYPLLIGRNFLRGDFLVDVDQKGDTSLGSHSSFYDTASSLVRRVGGGLLPLARTPKLTPAAKSAYLANTGHAPVPGRTCGRELERPNQGREGRHARVCATSLLLRDKCFISRHRGRRRSATPHPAHAPHNSRRHHSDRTVSQRSPPATSGRKTPDCCDLRSGRWRPTPRTVLPLSR